MTVAAFEGTSPASGGVRGLLKILGRRKLLIGTPVLAALAIGWLLAETLPRRYTAEAVLAVDARKVQIVANEVVSRLPPDSAALRTELDIIASRMIAERVVDTLGLLADNGVRAEISQDTSPAALLGSTIRTAAARLLGPSGYNGWLATQTRPPLSRADVVDWLLGHTKVSNDNRSLTIFTAFTSADPQRAAWIANAIARTYLGEQISLKDAVTRKVAARLAGKLSEMRQEMSVAEAAVADFRRTSGLMEAKGLTVVGQQLSELNTQIAIARADRARAEGKLQTARAGGGASLTDVLSSPAIQELRAQLSRAEVRLAENARNLYMLRELQVTVGSLRALLAAETGRIVASFSSEAEAAAAKEASLTTSLQRLTVEYGKASSATVQLNQLLREAEITRTSYEGFLTRLKQAIEHQGLAVPDALLISEAQPPNSPVSPKPLPLLLLAGLCGLFVGGTITALRERLDDRVRDVGQVSALAGIPILGMLPHMHGFGRRRSRIGLLPPGSRRAIAVQWLRAALQAPHGAKRAQVIMVTSAMAAEGKTSLSVCLAREFVRGGESVLVIDADPYRARVATAFGVASRLRPCLPDQECDAGQDTFTRLVQVDALSGAHFMAVTSLGEFHRLIRSNALAEFLDVARRNYHTIILDTAPTLAGADAATLGRLADIRLFAIRCGWTRWSQMVAALTMLRLCGSPVDGIVVMGAERSELYYSRTDYASWTGSGKKILKPWVAMPEAGLRAARSIRPALRL